MATRRTTFEKLQRERDKKAKAAAKRERRQEKNAEREDGEGGEGFEGLGGDTLTDSDEVVRPDMTPAEILEEIEVAHEQFKAGRMTSEAFEERKTELLTVLAELPIE